MIIRARMPKNNAFTKGSVHMKKVSILGVDLAKASFTICGLDEKGLKILTKEIAAEKFKELMSNLESTTIIFEACSGAHYWSRLATKLGHTAKIIAPQKVVGFRKNNKNDSNDAFAICIAALCPGMEFVPTKDVSHQDLQCAIRYRDRLMIKQTSLINFVRGILAEFGVIVPEGVHHIRSVMSQIANRSTAKEEYGLLGRLTLVVLKIVDEAQQELLEIIKSIEGTEKIISGLTSQNETCQKLLTIPGVGPITAASVVSTLINPNDYSNGRQYAASLGLTPRHVQTGGSGKKPILLGISKCGNSQLRSILVQGAMSVVKNVMIRRKAELLRPSVKESTKQSETSTDEGKKQISKNNGLHPARQPQKECGTKKETPKKEVPKRIREWIVRLCEEKGTQKAAVALANKNARIIWAITMSGKEFNKNDDNDYSAKSQEAEAA
jgi:transposase